MKKIIFYFIINSLCISFSIAQTKIPLVESMSLTERKISNYASSIRYVALETTDECLLTGELQIITTAQYIFVHDQLECKMYRFDATTGKYLNRIGRKGQGPGEYVRLHGFYIDDLERKCFLFCNTGIYVYNYKGDFLKKISLPRSYCSSRMERIGNYYVLNNVLYLDTKKELCLLDLQGKMIKERLLSYKAPIGFMLSIPFFYKQDGRCYYKNDLSETIYLLDEKLSLKPAYQIDCGKKATNPREDQFDINRGKYLVNGKIVIGRINGYKNKLYIPYFVNNKRFLAIYDIQTASIITVGKNGESGITDDLTDGPMILPPEKCSLYSSCVPGQLISWLYPGDIDTRKYTKGAFAKILKQVDEDSNPILRIINLK